MPALADRHLAEAEALKSALAAAGYRMELRPDPVMETSTEFELEVGPGTSLVAKVNTHARETTYDVTLALNAEGRSWFKRATRGMRRMPEAVEQCLAYQAPS